MRRISVCLALCSLLITSLSAQPSNPPSPKPYEDEAKRLLASGLATGKAYQMLQSLTSEVGHRLSGSEGNRKAVQWARATMERAGLENIRLEPVMVPHWVRGSGEEGWIVNSPSKGTVRLNITALGGSIATDPEGITAEVVEVTSFEQLHSMGGRAKGKIVFFNRPMDRSKMNPGEAYGGAVDQRSLGAIEAARAGGVAALVRSMTMRLDDVPHTGAMHYVDSVSKVPSAAISTEGAELLSNLLRREQRVTVRMKLSCMTLPDVESANVIGEIPGTEFPDEVIVIGGHLDSWDKGQGAHDDGAGCVQSIEALRLIRELGLAPKRTVRAVLFNNEENGLRGAKAYAEKDRPGERHIAAMETDAGGFTPRGFSVQSDSLAFESIQRWAYVFAPMYADRIRKGGSGADVGELYKKGVPALGLWVDGQRYFDYHHSDSDTIDKVHERELELGAIALATLAYVLAQDGI